MDRKLLFLLALLPSLAQASPPARPAKLGQCIACHGEDGRGRKPGIPNLTSQDETYLVVALKAYRAGTRTAVPMNSLANTLQPRDIAALAHWYSRQTGAASR